MHFNSALSLFLVQIIYSLVIQLVCFSRFSFLKQFISPLNQSLWVDTFELLIIKQKLKFKKGRIEFKSTKLLNGRNGLFFRCSNVNTIKMKMNSSLDSPSVQYKTLFFFYALYTHVVFPHSIFLCFMHHKIFVIS